MIEADLYKRIAFCKNPEYHTTAIILKKRIKLASCPAPDCGQQQRLLRLFGLDEYLSGRWWNRDPDHFEEIVCWCYNCDGTIEAHLEDNYDSDGDAERLMEIEKLYKSAGFSVLYEFSKYQSMKEKHINAQKA